MEVIRPLLVAGNGKLGGSIWHFDLPAVRTCPGRSRLCSDECYALRGHFAFPQVQERLEWCFEQSKRNDFVPRMVNELFRKGILVCRVHVAGDLYNPTYAKKWVEIVRQSKQTIFLCYTRSYRVKRIETVLRELASLDNMHLWYSADAETGVPQNVPERVRVAYMQTETEEAPEGVDLLFRVQRLRKRIELPQVAPVCNQETPDGRERGVTCSSCQFCWRE